MNMRGTTYCSSDISVKLRPQVSLYDLEMVHRLEQQYNGKMYICIILVDQLNQ